MACVWPTSRLATPVECDKDACDEAHGALCALETALAPCPARHLASRQAPACGLRVVRVVTRTVRCAWLHEKPGMRRPARRLRVACLWPASCFAFSAGRNSVVCDEAACEDEHGALYRK